MSSPFNRACVRSRKGRWVTDASRRRRSRIVGPSEHDSSGNAARPSQMASRSAACRVSPLAFARRSSNAQVASGKRTERGVLPPGSRITPGRASPNGAAQGRVECSACSGRGGVPRLSWNPALRSWEGRPAPPELSQVAEAAQGFPQPAFGSGGLTPSIMWRGKGVCWEQKRPERGRLSRDGPWA